MGGVRRGGEECGGGGVGKGEEGIYAWAPYITQMLRLQCLPAHTLNGFYSRAASISCVGAAIYWSIVYERLLCIHCVISDTHTCMCTASSISEVEGLRRTLSRMGCPHVLFSINI